LANRTDYMLWSDHLAVVISCWLTGLDKMTAAPAWGRWCCKSRFWTRSARC